MRQVWRAFVTLGLVVGLASSSFAASQTILGNKLIVKDPKPGVDATKRKVTFSAKEIASPNTIVGNPVVSGATLQVIANGNNDSSQVFSLPQGTNSRGKPFWKGIGPIGFKYNDNLGDQGAVTRLSIKRAPNGNFSIKGLILGRNGTLNVLPPNPGTDGFAVLLLGGGDTYCVQYGPEGISRNKLDKFWLTKKPINEGCPGAPPTTSTSTSTSTTTSSSSTTSTTIYGSPSKAFLLRSAGLLD
jgi:hypothetical protein